MWGPSISHLYRRDMAGHSTTEQPGEGRRGKMLPKGTTSCRPHGPAKAPPSHHNWSHQPGTLMQLTPTQQLGLMTKCRQLVNLQSLYPEDIKPRGKQSTACVVTYISSFGGPASLL